MPILRQYRILLNIVVCIVYYCLCIQYSFHKKKKIIHFVHYVINGYWKFKMSLHDALVLLETRVVSRCKNSSSRRISLYMTAILPELLRGRGGRSFRRKKRSKRTEGNKEYRVEPDGFYTSDRLFSLQTAVSLIIPVPFDPLSTSPYIRIPALSPAKPIRPVSSVHVYIAHRT